MSTPTRTDRAWSVYELALRALVAAKQRRRWQYSPYNHPNIDRRLGEAVERAQRALDRATDDLAEAVRWEA